MSGLFYKGVEIIWDAPLECDRAEMCANSSKEHRCANRAELGHIFCKPCRLALGGYDRYNRPAPKSA